MAKQLSFLLLLFSLVIALALTAPPALAQGGTGEQAEAGQPAPATGVVSGTVGNRTTGATVPESGEPMLHIWDANFQEKGMEHGQMLAGSTFRFEEVPFVPGWQYAVMLNYQGVNYYSDPVTVTAGQDTLSLDVPIYEVTTDVDTVRVMRQHIFFDAAAPGELLVGEIFILSNDGDRTIAPAAEADAAAAPLVFVLPEGAENIGLENNSNGRFQPTEAGFADTAPLRPGEGTAEVVVRYTLPYDEALTYDFTAPWPVDTLNLLLPERTGLTLEGDGLQPLESRQTADGNKVAVFSYEGLAAGETLTVRLTGELNAPVTAPAPATTDVAPVPAVRSSLPPVLVALGVFILALAFWLWRRPSPEPLHPSSSAPTFEALVAEIALLDEAHEAGRIDENDYSRRRSLLFAQARQLLPEGH